MGVKYESKSDRATVNEYKGHRVTVSVQIQVQE